MKSKSRTYKYGGVTVSLTREQPFLEYAHRPILSAPGETADCARDYIKPWTLDREVFAVGLLTVRHRLIEWHTVSVGCLTSSLVHPREVFKAVILSGAAAVVLVHNHPSDDPEPSADDVSLTRRLKAAGALLGIEVLDHVVVTACGRWVSLRDRGVL